MLNSERKQLTGNNNKTFTSSSQNHSAKCSKQRIAFTKVTAQNAVDRARNLVPTGGLFLYQTKPSTMFVKAIHIFGQLPN